MKEVYYAVLEEEKEGGYSASFPSLPGCFTQGDSIMETMENCNEVVNMFLEHLSDTKQEIPKEKDLNFIKNKINKKSILVPILVDAPSVSKQFSVTFPEKKLSKIDNFIKKKKITRSAFLLQGAEMLMKI